MLIFGQDEETMLLEKKNIFCVGFRLSAKSCAGK